uniref:Clathrin/coatomer adaptor adaptin-like N-terminal domain-containing protein n=1 Tax=Lepeophtheirus salmonis TaxID=72036 RepID=A0A0K2TXV5_LEPSM
MSAMIGRTWNYLTAAVSPVSNSTIKWTPPKDLASPGSDLPKGLASFLKALVTQPDYQRIIEDNITLVKAKLEEPDVKNHAVADCLLRMTMADMLGFNVEFARVHALKLAQKGDSLPLRKIGYLTSVALLKESQDPLNLLLVNTIIKDLSSKNPIEINFALCASSSHLIPDEVIPLLLPSLISKTTHIKDFIRKKALASLHKLLKRNPELACSIEGPTRRCLIDPNPGVVAVAIQVAMDLVEQVDLFDILPGILDVADQILDDKFPNEFKYKSLSAPWMLCDAISLLSRINKKETNNVSSKLSERYVHFLKRVISKSFGSKEMISCAIIFECIKAISILIDKNSKTDLITKALPAVSKFLQDKSSNLKYMGIASMELIFMDTDLVLSTEQENIISSCLSYPDESIRRKTLSLLYVLAHDKNVRQICTTLLSYIKESDDKYKRKEFITKTSDLADKFIDSQGMDWYINVLLRLSQLSPSEMRYDFLYRIKSTLGSKCSNPKEQSSIGSKLKSILSRFLLSDGVKISKSITSLYIWCWSHFDPKFEDFSSIIELAIKADNEESVIDALSYIFIHNPTVCFPMEVHEFITKCLENQNERIKDKAREIKFLIKILEGETLPKVSTLDDFTLTFLDKYIVEKIGTKQQNPFNKKMSPYHEAVIPFEDINVDKSKLRLAPYNELSSLNPNNNTVLNTLAEDELSEVEHSIWSFDGCKKDENNIISNKLSDSMESFFVEEKNQSFGLDSLLKDDLLTALDEE